MKKSPIRRRRRTKFQRDFYHPDCPVLYRDHDEIGDLKDCPFPLVHPTFRVVFFGRLKFKPDGTFAVVEYRKSCGHVVWERIPFEEHVKDFDHYGTKFYGVDYKIANWERRIEFFRTILPCEVCQLVSHSLRIWLESLSEEHRSLKRQLAYIEYLLECNYANWREFVDLDRLRAALLNRQNGFSYKDASKWAIQRDP